MNREELNKRLKVLLVYPAIRASKPMRKPFLQSSYACCLNDLVKGLFIQGREQRCIDKRGARWVVLTIDAIISLLPASLLADFKRKLVDTAKVSSPRLWVGAIIQKSSTALPLFGSQWVIPLEKATDDGKKCHASLVKLHSSAPR